MPPRESYNIGVRLNQPPTLQRPRQISLEGKRSGYTLTTFPLPQSSKAQCREVSPEPLFPLEGKENLVGTASTSHHWDHSVGVFTLILQHESCRAICKVQPLGFCQRIGEGLVTISPWILAYQVLTCSDQAVILTSDFAFLQN